MANPTSVGVDDAKPACIEATTTSRSLTLNAQRQYTLKHSGVSAAGATTTDTIYLAFGAAVTTVSDLNEANKWSLQDGQSVVVGPQLKTLYFRTAANSPTFAIMPSAQLFGDF